MLLDLEITEHDIEVGLPQRFDKCPIALAVRRALGHTGNDTKFVSISVDCYHIEVGNFGRCRTSTVMQNFIRAFDKKRPEAVPFSARIRLRAW